METNDEIGHQPPQRSVVTWFRHRQTGDPGGIVIGPEHRPNYIFEDGRTEVVSDWDGPPED